MGLLDEARKIVETTPLLRDLGMKVEHLGEGECRCSLPITPQVINPHGVLHGGITFTLADTGMGFAIYSALESGERTSTIAMYVRYLRPATGQQIIANCRVVDRQTSLATTQAEIVNDAGEVVALADGSFHISRRNG